MDRLDTDGRRDRRARYRLAGALAGLALLLAATPVAADVGGGGSDLGLSGITITAATINPASGLVTISGEIECSEDVHDVNVGAGAEQLVGRLNVISGSAGTSLDCAADPGLASWSVSFYGYNGKFAPGNARVGASAFVFFCTDEECFEDGVETGVLSVRLTRA